MHIQYTRHTWTEDALACASRISRFLKQNCCKNYTSVKQFIQACNSWWQHKDKILQRLSKVYSKNWAHPYFKSSELANLDDRPNLRTACCVTVFSTTQYHSLLTGTKLAVWWPRQWGVRNLQKILCSSAERWTSNNLWWNIMRKSEN